MERWKRELNAMPGKGKPFEKGNRLGLGRPPLSKEERLIREMNREKCAQILNEISWLSKSEIVLRFKDPATSVFEAAIISSYLMAIKKGELKNVNDMLDRMIGKVKNDVHLSGTFTQANANLTDEQREAVWAAIVGNEER